MRRVLGWAVAVTMALIPGAVGASDRFLLAGSASLDYRYLSGTDVPPGPSPLGITGLTLEAAAKGVIDVGHGVSFSAKACVGCHGFEVDQAYGEVLLTPAFNLRVGRINVPFGEFNVRHDPVNFTTPSKPMPYAMGDMLHYGPSGFNLGVVPAPFVDNGIEVFGSVPLSGRHQLDYAVYVAEGLAGSNDIDFAQSRRLLDNNKTPAGGARLVLTGDDWAVGASGSGGTYDAADRLAYLMGAIELYLRLGPVTFRAEGAARRTDLDRTVVGYPFVLIDPFLVKVGWYAQLDFNLGERVVATLRSDGVHRFGVPLPGSDLASPSAGAQRQTAAALVRVNEHLAFKADYELWTFVGAGYPLRHVARAAIVVGM